MEDVTKTPPPEIDLALDELAEYKQFDQIQDGFISPTIQNMRMNTQVADEELLSPTDQQAPPTTPTLS